MKFLRFLMLTIISLISQQALSQQSGLKPRLPEGSYKQSCKDCTYSTDKGLFCKCRKIKGNYISTTKNGCSFYDNINGVLTCGLPTGSYKQSCKDCTYSTDKGLSCECRKINGKYISTTKKGCLSYENIDGVLRCE